MKQEQFEKVIEKQIEMIKETLLVKSKEYSTEDTVSIYGMLSKHTVSIYDMIHSGDRYHVDKWDEKINDHIVYLLLLRAIIEEKVCEEYIIESGREPIMVNNPTYSFFMETLKRPSRPEMLDKKFNIPPPCDEQYDKIMEGDKASWEKRIGGLNMSDNLVIKFKKPCYKCNFIKPVTDEILTLSGMGEPRFNMVIVRCEHDQVCGIYLDHKEEPMDEIVKEAHVVQETVGNMSYLMCNNCGAMAGNKYCDHCGYKLIYPESGADSETR